MTIAIRQRIDKVTSILEKEIKHGLEDTGFSGAFKEAFEDLFSIDGIGGMIYTTLLDLESKGEVCFEKHFEKVHPLDKKYSARPKEYTPRKNSSELVVLMPKGQRRVFEGEYYFSIVDGSLVILDRDNYHTAFAPGQWEEVYRG